MSATDLLCHTSGDDIASLLSRHGADLSRPRFAPRLLFDPAVRAGSAAGQERARAGELTKDAARAATGRPVPEQRRVKAAAARVPHGRLDVAGDLRRVRPAAHLASPAGRGPRLICVGICVADRVW
jgi:hypothetical protein